MASAAALLPMRVVAELCSIGTLFAFLIVCVGVLVLRYKQADLVRPFQVPLFPVLPAVGALLCAYLMSTLPQTAWQRFLLWLLVGLGMFFTYGFRKSRLAQQAAWDMDP